MSRVFISYARADGIPYAEEIENRLLSHKLNPWRDKKDIPGGNPWNIEIDEAIADSYAMIVIATETACTKSIGVTYEWARALGAGNTKVLVVHFDDFDKVPKQLSAFNQYKWGEPEFWYKLIRDLQRFQTEDSLVGVRVPVEADAQLRELARRAFNPIHSQDENCKALDALFDMHDDPIARQILINGLNHRSYSLVNHILLKMAAYRFDEDDAFEKLITFVFMPVSDDAIAEQKWNHVRRQHAANVLKRWPKKKINDLTFLLKKDDLRVISLILPIVYAIDPVSSVRYINDVLDEPYREEASWGLDFVTQIVNEMVENPAHPLRWHLDTELWQMANRAVSTILNQFKRGDDSVIRRFIEAISKLETDSKRFQEWRNAVEEALSKKVR